MMVIFVYSLIVVIFFLSLFLTIRSLFVRRLRSFLLAQALMDNENQVYDRGNWFFFVDYKSYLYGNWNIWSFKKILQKVRK